VIKDWESQDDPKHLTTIRDRLLSKQHRIGRLLGLYNKILDSEDNKAGKVIFDDSLEQWQLRLSGLVVKDDDELRIQNRIYKNVFGRRWVNKALGEWEPYAKNITNWLDSDCENEAFLLREKVLEDAVAWAEDKSLSDKGYKFLMDSLKVAKQEIQDKLASVEEKLKVQNQEYEIVLSTHIKKNKNILEDLAVEKQKDINLQDELEKKIGFIRNHNEYR
jgi:hypothetical protein